MKMLGNLPVVIITVDPIQKSNGFLAAVREVAVEHQIQHTRIGLSDMTESEAKLAFGFFDRKPFFKNHIKHAHKTDPVSAGLAVKQNRIFDAFKESLRLMKDTRPRSLARLYVEIDQLDAMSLASALFKAVTAAITVAAQIYNGLEPPPCQKLNIVRCRLT